MHPSVIFGPVASSRLGRSLGLDLLGRKICSFDCVYCEVGPTRLKTLERSEYISPDRLLEELVEWKKTHQELDLDYVTLGGMGEPTLNTALPAVIQGARAIFPGVPVAVLTNSSLLPDPGVRNELALADAVLPSMDALSSRDFKRINRPHPRVDIEALARGLLDFRNEFAGRLYLEILLVQGLNDTQENLELLRDYVAQLRPDRVDVVTMTRPGTWDKSRPVGEDTLKAWRDALGVDDRRGKVPVKPGMQKSFQDIKDAIHSSLLRRGQTAEQLSLALGVGEEEVRDALASLLKQRHIREEGSGNSSDPAGLFYKALPRG